jgi:hypothetical protein
MIHTDSQTGGKDRQVDIEVVWATTGGGGGQGSLNRCYHGIYTQETCRRLHAISFRGFLKMSLVPVV